MYDRKILSSKKWAFALGLSLVVLFSIFHTPTRQFVSDALPHPRRSCSGALDSQVQMLKSEYSKLLPDITHVAMIGFPDHSNKGDSAIWVGEMMILETLKIEVVHICIDNDICNNTKIRESLEAHGGPDKTAILFHGGGNFGDIWHNIQENRERVVVDFLDYKIRSFPQTYKFTEHKKLVQAQDAYGQHPDLQLTVRDTKSFSRLQRDFGKKHKVMLVPDAATMLLNSPVLSRAPKKSDIDFLFLARTDGEGGQQHDQEWPIIDELKSVTDHAGAVHEANITITDWIEDEPAGIRDVSLEEAAQLRVEWTYDFLGQGPLILSDRLHVHILSTLWGIDHITIEQGTYAKLQSYHDTWLLDCGDRVVSTQSVREAVDAAKRWFKDGKSFS